MDAEKTWTVAPPDFPLGPRGYSNIRVASAALDMLRDLGWSVEPVGATGKVIEMLESFTSDASRVLEHLRSTQGAS